MSASAKDTVGCPSTECLELVLAGGGDGALRRAVIRHMLSGCPVCRESARRASGLEASSGEEVPLPRLAEMLTRLENVRVEHEAEQQRARELMSGFLEHPPARQWTLLRNSGRFDFWGFAEQLSAAAFEAMYDDPHRSLELSRMALEVGERLDREHYGRPLHDLKARLLARLGNALRAVGDLGGAEARFTAASTELEAGTGDPMEEGELCYFVSSLRRAQRRLDEALRLARRSRRLFREIGDTLREGRAWVAEGAIQEVAGNLEPAIDCARRAIAKVDEREDPRLALAARHNLLWYLVQTDRAGEAMDELERLRPRYIEQGDRMNLLKLRWMEGRLARRLGARERAEAILRETCEAFSTAGVPYEAAVAGLDLALLLAEERRHAEVAELAGELLDVFRSLGVGRETVAAWVVFEGAARAQLVTVALVERLAAFMAVTRQRPDVAFDAGLV